MGKIKINRKNNYTIISNHVLKNVNLTLKAKGLFVYMWSLPDDWNYSVAGLVTNLKEGKASINEALKELEREGYLVRTILRNGGKFADMDYVLHEFPQKSPFTDFPSAEKPSAENQPLLNTNKQSTKESNPFPTEKGGASKKSYSLVFDDPSNRFISEALQTFVTSCKARCVGFQYKTLERWAMILRENAKEDPALALEIVKQSIDNGWKDLYPLKNMRKNAYVKKEAVSIPVSKEDKATNEDGKYVVY